MSRIVIDARTGAVMDAAFRADVVKNLVEGLALLSADWKIHGKPKDSRPNWKNALQLLYGEQIEYSTAMLWIRQANYKGAFEGQLNEIAMATLAEIGVHRLTYVENLLAIATGEKGSAREQIQAVHELEGIQAATRHALATGEISGATGDSAARLIQIFVGGTVAARSHDEDVRETFDRDLT